MEDGRRAQARRFLELLFADALEADDRLMFLITSIEPLTDKEKEGRKPHIRTRAFSHIDDRTVDHVFEQCDVAGMDTYVCMGMVRENPARGKRSSESDVYAITAFWQDFDIHTPGVSKKGKKYPPSLDAVEKLINIGPHKPSFRVLSGYGVHGYWRTAEPWLFADERDRKEAKLATYRVCLTFRDRAALEGWTLDATYDLVRIMRIPGTLNFKRREDPRPVELEEPATESSFEFSDLEDYLVDAAYSPSAMRPKHTWSQTVDFVEIDRKRVREIPPKISLMLENNEEFRESWCSRSAINDRSPSGYDLSCVNFMVQDGLTDQEIADAIAYRRMKVEKHGDRMKGLRLSYVQATIGKVRSDTKPDLDALKKAHVVAPIDKDGEPEKLDEHDRERFLQSLRSFLKIDVVRYVQVGRDEPQHYLETPDGLLKLGTTEELFKFDAVSNNLWNQHDLALQEDLRKDWKRVVKQVLQPLKEVDDTTESTKVDKMLVMLQAYVEDVRPEPAENWRRAVSTSRPFYEKDKVWIRLPDFKRVLRVQNEGRFFRNHDEAIALFKQASEFTPKNGSYYNKGKAWVGDNGKTKRYFPFSVFKIDQGTAADPETE